MLHIHFQAQPAFCNLRKAFGIGSCVKSVIELLLFPTAVDFKVIEQDRNIPYALCPAINQLHIWSHPILNNRPEQGIVGAAQDKGIYSASQRLQGFIDHFFGKTGMKFIGLYQRYKLRSGQTFHLHLRRERFNLLPIDIRRNCHWRSDNTDAAAGS